MFQDDCHYSISSSGGFSSSSVCIEASLLMFVPSCACGAAAAFAVVSSLLLAQVQATVDLDGVSESLLFGWPWTVTFPEDLEMLSEEMDFFTDDQGAGRTRDGQAQQ